MRAPRAGADCGIPQNTRMPDASHLLIAYAASTAEGCQQALRALALPHLERLLARLAPLPGGDATGNGAETAAGDAPGAAAGAGTIAAAADETSLSPPHERALARALGLPGADGRIPWAAWHVWHVWQHRPQGLAADGGQAWAFVTPCQWQVGSDHVTLRDPGELALDEAATRTLLAVAAPWFAADGIALHYDRPGRWLACGAPFADLATASLDRALLRDLRHWLPDARRAPQQSHQARTLARLHSEVQMLLHTHPLNSAREQRGQPPVNAFWLHGAGALPASTTGPIPTAAQPVLPSTLRSPALHGDWRAWAQEWAALDAGPVATLLHQAQSGQRVQLTLCGERRAIALHGPQRALLPRLQCLIRPVRWKTLGLQL